MTVTISSLCFSAQGLLWSVCYYLRLEKPAPISEGDRHGTQACSDSCRRYRRLLGADGAGRSRRIPTSEAGHRELLEPEIQKHNGRIFKLMGDGLLAEFGSVVDAVEYAAAPPARYGEQIPSVPKRAFKIRIGINFGEVIVEGEDRYGEGVNIAARLQALADPGGICVSGKVRKGFGSYAFAFEPMGDQRLRTSLSRLPAIV